MAQIGPSLYSVDIIQSRTQTKPLDWEYQMLRLHWPRSGAGVISLWLNTETQCLYSVLLRLSPSLYQTVSKKYGPQNLDHNHPNKSKHNWFVFLCSFLNLLYCLFYARKNFFGWYFLSTHCTGDQGRERWGDFVNNNGYTLHHTISTNNTYFLYKPHFTIISKFEANNRWISAFPLFNF